MSAVGANLADNLPAYLAMEPVADGSPLRMAAPAHLGQHRTADHAVGKPGHVVVGGPRSRRRRTGPLAYVRGPRVDGRPDPFDQLRNRHRPCLMTPRGPSRAFAADCSRDPPSEHAARPGRAIPNTGEGLGRGLAKPKMLESCRSAKVWLEGQVNYRVSPVLGRVPRRRPHAYARLRTTAVCARWRTPRLSRHPRRAPHRCHHLGRCRLCRLRDRQGFRWQRVPDRPR